MPCWGCLLASAQRAKKVIPSQHGDTFSYRTEGGFLLVFYLVIHTKGHPVTRFRSEATERARWFLTSRFHRNPTPHPLLDGTLFLLWYQVFTKGTFPFPGGGFPWELAAHLETGQHQGKESRRMRSPIFNHLSPCKVLSLLKVIFAKGKVLMTKNVVTQQYE